MQNGKQSDEQYLKKLYDRFVGDVMYNRNSEFYDENELLDIFDYAQDEGDELTQMYVLLSGARLYPDSKFLDERKAFFLAAINETSARKMLERKGLQNNDLWEVLRLTLGIYPEGCDVDEAVRRLLASDFTLSCEAVIRIIDWLHDIDRLDILVANLEVIAEKSETPDIFYYETAEALYHDDYYKDIARNIAEDLTASYPFNADNWILLAKIEFSLQNLEECLSAVDYALAIDPDSENGLLVKAIAYVAYANRSLDHGEELSPDEAKLRKQRIDESTILLKHVLRINSRNGIAIRTMAEALVLEELPDCAVDLLKTYMSFAYENSFAIIDAMRLHPAKTDDIFEIFATHHGSNERAWIETAGRIDSEGNIHEAVAMLEWYHARYGLHEGMEYLLSLLYRSRRYARYIALFTSCCETAQQIGGTRYEFSTMVYLMLAASHLMEHNFSETLEICDLILSTLPHHPASIEDHIRIKGIQLTVSLLHTLAESKSDDIDTPDFDPLCVKIGSDV